MQEEIARASDRDGSIYHGVLGGPEPLRWFGRAPSIHDAEIFSLEPRRKPARRSAAQFWTCANQRRVA